MDFLEKGLAATYIVTKPVNNFNMKEHLKTKQPFSIANIQKIF